MKRENGWLIVCLEVAGWLVMLLALVTTVLVGLEMVAMFLSWLLLVGMARILAGQELHARRLQRAIERLEIEATRAPGPPPSVPPGT